MSPYIAILEDNDARISLMRTCLAGSFPGFTAVFFDKSAEMIGWLAEHLGEVSLISLDHDLPVRMIEGKAVDFGTGREVADFLAGLPPTCPVIVHSSNDPCARGMMDVLRTSDWPITRVWPQEGEAWIRRDWAEEVYSLKANGWFSA